MLHSKQQILKIDLHLRIKLKNVIHGDVIGNSMILLSFKFSESWVSISLVPLPTFEWDI